MKILYAILLFDIALLCGANAEELPLLPPHDPTPAQLVALGDLPAVISPDEITTAINSNSWAHADYISSLIANGEIIYYVPPAVSKTTGERLKVSFRKPIVVPAEVLAMPQYTEGAVWRRTYTSAGTNYVLITTVATGFGTPTAEGGR